MRLRATPRIQRLLTAKTYFPVVSTEYRRMGSLPLNPALNSISVPQPPRSNLKTHLAIGLSVGIGLGLAKHRSLVAKVLREACNRKLSTGHQYLWGGCLACLSLAETATAAHMENMVVESTTGVCFPSCMEGEDAKKLAGVGVRKKSIMGLKSIKVYAFGLYADEQSLKETLLDKYGKQSATELKVNKEFYEDVIGNDLGLTVRLEIVFGKLSIGSVRSAFEESIGSRLQKFSGTQKKELLQRFTSQFQDDYKLARGTKIDITRLPSHILQTKIDGKEIGSIQSQLLCRSLFDIYIGDDPLDKQAKEKIGLGLASLLA